MAAAKAGTVQGIVLAGVHQWDDEALDAIIPRPLLPVVHAPLVSYAVNWLREGGVGSATICANSASRHVRRCLGAGNRLGMELEYYEDWTPRGPAGCIRDAGLAASVDTFVAIDGTIIPQINLPELLDSHLRSRALVTIAVNGHWSREEPASQLHPIGAYVFSRAALEHVGVTGYQDIKEVLIPRLHQLQKAVLVYSAEVESPRVTGFDSYLAVNAMVLARVLERPTPPAGYERKGDALVHCTADVARNVRFMGATIVGPKARIATGAVIVGPTVIGTGCQIEAGAVVCRAVLWDMCQIGRAALVDRSIVGHYAEVEAGVEIHSHYQPSLLSDARTSDVLSASNDAIAVAAARRASRSPSDDAQALFPDRLTQSGKV